MNGRSSFDPNRGPAASGTVVAQSSTQRLSDYEAIVSAVFSIAVAMKPVPKLHKDRIPALPRLNSRLFDRKVPWVRHAVIAFCENAGVTVISAQGLRGSHASTAVETGETAEAVARQLGHDHKFVTERHYIRDDVTADATAERFAAELATEDHVVAGKNKLEPGELEREIARLQRLLECAKEAQNLGHKNGNPCVQNGKLASAENHDLRKIQ